MEYIVEELKPGDFEKFYEFASDFILNRYEDYPRQVRKKYLENDLNKDQLKEDIKKAEAEVLVAFAEGGIIGFAVLAFERGGATHIQWMAVDEKHRGHGVGSKLLSLAEEVAKEHKCHFVILWTESEKNIKFYQKRGYYLVGLQRQAWYGIDENLMQKNLCPPFPIEE